MLPFDNYYKMNLLIDGKANESPGYPWSSRHIANFFNYFIYKIAPCIEVSKIPNGISRDVYCSYWGLALSNYICTVLFQMSSFIYVIKILKRTMIEGIIVLFISYFIISLSDRFGVDRFSILCISIFLFFINQKLYKYLFIFTSIFINEKITIFIASYYFCENISQYKRNNKIDFLSTILPVSLFFAYIFYHVVFDIEKSPSLIMNHLNGSIVDRNFFTFHALANSLIPILITTLPYLFFFKDKNILKEFRLERAHVIILILFTFLGWLGGGSGNAGRLIIYTSPIFLPIYGYFLMNFIKKLKI
tara:strand:- start:163 stop:1074 length:912 start_codon:yes stop_codon:yes gene_type:complete